ncbi:Hypothetical predicted protein [Mytilus galloprovincialis]|uniref:Uncharacterized protein n=1 Tax=Mytilus galloprovincialis TaxID=29158 RepID=A0A8B6H0L5_MYTGA|nr:Hypothetical predicted protein [Mytilus galloprovincialis]
MNEKYLQLVTFIDDASHNVAAFMSDHLPGGKLNNISEDMKLKVKAAPKTSSYAESVFGQLDHLIRTRPSTKTLAAEKDDFDRLANDLECQRYRSLNTYKNTGLLFGRCGVAMGMKFYHEDQDTNNLAESYSSYLDELARTGRLKNKRQAKEAKGKGRAEEISNRHGKGPCDREIGTVKKSVVLDIKSRRAKVSDAKTFYGYCRKELNKPKEPLEHVHFKRTCIYIPFGERNRNRADRERSCFCMPCITLDGICENEKIVGKWIVSTLEKRARRLRPNDYAEEIDEQVDDGDQ